MASTQPFSALGRLPVMFATGSLSVLRQIDGDDGRDRLHGVAHVGVDEREHRVLALVLHFHVLEILGDGDVVVLRVEQHAGERLPLGEVEGVALGVAAADHRLVEEGVLHERAAAEWDKAVVAHVGLEGRVREEVVLDLDRVDLLQGRKIKFVEYRIWHGAFRCRPRLFPWNDRAQAKPGCLPAGGLPDSRTHYGSLLRVP
jgi:hypothetical protein